jgi:catechol 2,3-dioxygenase-like lactoylglutathione lyase family enzyme
MLAASKLIGFVPTLDSAKAREFYEGKLGFRFVSDDMFALVVSAGENMIRIAKAKEFTPAPYTVLGWEVRSIEEVVAWLEERGVVFEKYPRGSGQGTRHMGRARRRQSCLVQRSRRQRALGEPTQIDRAERRASGY